MTSSGSSDPAAQPALEQDSGETAGELQLCNLLSPARLCWRTVVTAEPALRQQLCSILGWQRLEQTALLHQLCLSVLYLLYCHCSFLLLSRDSLQCPPSQRCLSSRSCSSSPRQQHLRETAATSEGGASPSNEPPRLPKPRWPLRRQQKPLPGARCRRDRRDLTPARSPGPSRGAEATADPPRNPAPR